MVVHWWNMERALQLVLCDVVLAYMQDLEQMRIAALEQAKHGSSHGECGGLRREGLALRVENAAPRNYARRYLDYQKQRKQDMNVVDNTGRLLTLVERIRSLWRVWHFCALPELRGEAPQVPYFQVPRVGWAGS